MKKTFLLFLISLIFVTAAVPALAGEELSPVTRLFRSERDLLLSCGNVTMTGRAVFSLNGEVFKTADLTHIQDGTASVRDWRLLTPVPGTDGVRETGYTVVTDEEKIYAFESYEHRFMEYWVDASRQRAGILRHTGAGETLFGMADFIVEQCGSFGQADSFTEADGSTTVTLDAGMEDVPPVLDTLLNGVLQFGLNRYTGWYSAYDYASFEAQNAGHYTDYGTVSRGLLYCLKFVRLNEIRLRAVLDPEGRVREAVCTLTLDYIEKNGECAAQITAEIEQKAFDYGTSAVRDDPFSYDHWGD